MTNIPTSVEDNTIIALFFDRSEQAIQELSQKYGKLFHKLSYRILNNSFDAEECVNDAYLGVWNSIPPTKPDSLLPYVCKIVRNLSLKRYRQNSAAKRNSLYDVALEELETWLPAVSSENVEHTIETKELVHLIEQFLDTLTKENRTIFLYRYWFCTPYSDIAKQIGISEKNVSVRLVRIRKQLKQYLESKEVFL